MIRNNWVLQNLEYLTITQLPIQLHFYFRYVDDILLAAPTEFFDDILTLSTLFTNECNLPWKLVIAIALTF